MEKVVNFKCENFGQHQASCNQSGKLSKFTHRLFTHGGQKSDVFKQLEIAAAMDKEMIFGRSLPTLQWVVLDQSVIRKKEVKEPLLDLSMYRSLDRKKSQYPLSNRYYHSLCCIGERFVYLFGGETVLRNTSTSTLYELKALSDLWRYDLEMKDWEHFDSIEQTSSMQKGITCHSLTYDSKHKVLLCFGGCIETGVMRIQAASKYLYSLKLSDDGGNVAGSAWQQIPFADPWPGNRYGHSSFMYQGKMYIYAGLDRDDMWCFDYETMEWTQIEYKSSIIPAGRKNQAITMFQEGFFMFGGHIGSPFGKEYEDRTLYYFNLLTHRWQKYDNFYLLPRQFHCMCAWKNHASVYVFIHGGENRAHELVAEDCLVGPIDYGNFLMKEGLHRHLTSAIFVDMEITTL